MGDTFHLEGVLRIYELPEDMADPKTFKKWWHKFNASEKEREGKLVVDCHNLITTLGFTQLLTYAGSPTTINSFSQYYAVGTGQIYQVAKSDTQLAGEIFRAVPASFSIIGEAVTVSTLFTASQAIGNWTNSGMFGVNATSAANSGHLHNHLLYTYTKGNTAVTNDWYVLTD